MQKIEELEDELSCTKWDTVGIIEHKITGEELHSGHMFSNGTCDPNAEDKT